MYTGNARGAGTDANVVLTLYGEKGKSDEFKLGNKTDNFESGKVDKFKVGRPVCIFEFQYSQRCT